MAQTQLNPQYKRSDTAQCLTAADELRGLSLSPRAVSHPLVVGCGPAARRNYFPYFDKLHDSTCDGIAALIELESARSVVEPFLAGLRRPPREVIWLPESAKLGSPLPEHVVRRLDCAVAEGKIDGIIIATEPKSHLAYLQWAIPRGLPVLLEKPISAPINACLSEDGARQIWSDYTDFRALIARHPGSSVTIMAQRREHPGFKFILNYLKEFLWQHEVPVTFVDIFKSDGLWTFPHEYQKESHPFKYGYGMLLHGGYHFIDVMAQIVNLSRALPGREIDRIKTLGSFSWPADAMNQLTERNYARMFPEYHFESPDTSTMGELDAHALFEFKQGAHTLTHGKLSVMHNSFSRRAWPVSKQDTYKGNGRLRHERLHVMAGPLLSIMMHSYQAFENDAEPAPDAIRDDSVGGRHHFNVQIFRNSDLVGGKAIETFDAAELLGESASSHIQAAREKILASYLAGRPTNGWDDHELSCRMLSELALCAARHSTGAIPVSTSALTTAATISRGEAGPAPREKSDGLEKWADALSAVGYSQSVAASMRVPMYRRYERLNSLALLRTPIISISASAFLSSPELYLARIPGQELFPFLESKHPDGTELRFKNPVVPRSEISDAVTTALGGRDPADFVLTLQKAQRMRLNGNIIVGVDGSFLAEFVAGGMSPSQSGATISVSATRDPFLGVFRFTGGDEETRRLVHIAIAALPGDGEGRDRVYRAGYYEVGIAEDPDTGKILPIFYDYRDGEFFTKSLQRYETAMAP